MAVSGYSTPLGRSSTPVNAANFTSAPSVHAFSGLLFDMDGTIIDSTFAIVNHWRKIGKEFNIDPDIILATSHGRRSIDVFRTFSPDHANWEYIRALEGQIPLEYGSSAIEIPGSRTLLSVLTIAAAPWAIVTSGTQPLVSGWLSVMKLSAPANIVTAEDVEQGKPDPACYALGRERLGLNENDDVLVIEDAPAGIRAGKAAGCKVLGLTTTHSISQVIEAGADWVVRDLESLVFRGWNPESGKIVVEIRGAVKE